MAAVKADFEQRCAEIECYVAYLQDMEKSSGIDPSLMATMKASAFLMIYNLVESTMTNVIESIFDHLKANNTIFQQLDSKLKGFVLRCAKNHAPEKLVKKMVDHSLDLAVAAFKREDIFSGNIDSKKIREILSECGVAMSGRYAESALLEVKTARNDLAHGARSFSDLGKHHTAAEIEKRYFLVCRLLNKAVADVEAHIAVKLKVA